MMEASAFVQPRLPALSADPLAILPQAPPAAAYVSTSHLPAIMDGNVGPAIDGSTSTAAHNVDGVATKPPENAPLTAAQLRDKVLVARSLVATDRKARVSSFVITLTNGAVTTAPKHACVYNICLTVILLISP